MQIHAYVLYAFELKQKCLQQQIDSMHTHTHIGGLPTVRVLHHYATISHVGWKRLNANKNIADP